MTDIRTLDEATIAKIAAGEVVERPASVAKELVENSLDAEASRIDVTAAAGGTELVRVSDDGTGMAESAVRRAIEQHTTSKIESIDDLEDRGGDARVPWGSPPHHRGRLQDDDHHQTPGGAGRGHRAPGRGW